jgi:hypothetical protein
MRSSSVRSIVVAASVTVCTLAVFIPFASAYASDVTWTDLHTPGTNGWWSIASSADGTKLAAVDLDNNTVWVSADSGRTWTESLTDGGSNSFLDITSSSDGTKLAVVSFDGDIWTSSDS